MDRLLDTNAFSDLMREHPQVVARLAGVLPLDTVMICPIVRGEILHGIGRMPEGKRKRALAARAEALFETIPCVPLPESAGDHYAIVKSARQRQGLAMDENDLWIAATALALGAVLVSRDSDVQQIDGLDVEDWTKS